jgi:hypothetical protein
MRSQVAAGIGELSYLTHSLPESRSLSSSLSMFAEQARHYHRPPVVIDFDLDVRLERCDFLAKRSAASVITFIFY